MLSIMTEAPRKGFRFVGHLRSERRPLLLELGSEARALLKDFVHVFVC